MNNKVKFLRGTSDEYAVAEKDSDTIYFTTDDGKLYIGDKEVSGDGSYELPIATTEILGGVMPDGTTITVDENGVISAVTPSGQNYLIQYGTVSTKNEGRVTVYFPQSYKSVPKIFGYCEMVGPSVVEWAAVHVRTGSYFEACSTWFTDGSISQRSALVNWLAIGEV